MIGRVRSRLSWRWTMSAALIAVALVASSAAAQVAGLPQSAPHGGYFVCFAPYYDGDFRNAGAAFRDAAQGRIITTAQTPWIDSICYHTMMGECSYQLGNLPDALDQYSTALKIFLANRYWLLRIDFDSQPLMPEENSKEVITWGATKRRTTLGHFPDHYSSLRGRLDNQNVLRTGGIIDPPELHPVYVTEVIRCTALALSRRRALMGPVCEHDPLTEQLVAALALRPGPPNHWSQCWVELELGLAYAEANKVPEAVQELTKSLLAVDRYDHPLTCVGLLELGRLAYEQGKYDAAITYLHEATISAAFFDRYDVMEEAFRLGAEAHLVSGQKGVYPPLVPATLALAKKSRPLSVSLLTSLADDVATTKRVIDAQKGHVVVVGHSYGGSIALQLAVDAPG
jgi:tetratricopeptide (TPR) repeat protein